MPAAKYIVDLTTDEREYLDQLSRRGKPSARKARRAQILLKADEHFTDEEIAEILTVSVATVGRVRQRWVEEGLASALQERRRPGRRARLTGRQEAHVVAVACSKAPAGHNRWTLRLLADRLVELGLVESICHETVRQVLKKTILSPGNSSRGVSPQ
jgi:transposase